MLRVVCCVCVLCVRVCVCLVCVCACCARVQDLSTATDVQTVTKDGSNEVEKIIWEEKDNDHKVTMTTSRTPPHCT